jgi:hypothetical protein
MGDINSDKCINLDLTDNHWQILNDHGTGFKNAEHTIFINNGTLFDCFAEATGL